MPVLDSCFPRRRSGLAAALAAALAAGASGSAGAQAVAAAALADLTLEQLREVVVSTMSRTPQRLDRLPASVYVIGGDAIRRSGATTLPEALRLAPTLQVARADANQYAINARGYGNVLANRMLVLIDGRNVYTPLFSGVFWEAQDVMLDDVDRIEVVTGPGTALWGSNAVNALVHVITKPAAATLGAAATVQAGNRERGAALRWGAQTGRAAWRGYVKGWDRGDTRRADGASVADAARGVQAGWRADWAGDGGARLTLQGDAYRGRGEQPSPGGAGSAREYGGANVAAHWERSTGAADNSVHLVLDHTERDHPGSFSDQLDTVDLAAQRAWTTGAHRIALGGGSRRSRDRASGGPALAFIPGTRGMGWHRLFAQDQVQLAPDWAATLAVSVERNPYTGVETLPSARLAWNATAGGVAWASLSRAVRAPSRVDREFYAPAQPPHALAGGPDFRSELSDVAELGWRAQPSPALAYAAALYHAQQHRLRSLAPTAQGAQWRNDIEGRDTGVEAWARWQPVAAWLLDAGLTLREPMLRVVPGAVDAGGLAALGNSPRRQAALRSGLDLPRGWRWDADLRHVGALPNPAVPAYTAFDTRLAWSRAGVEWTVGVDNVFDPRHAEWGTPANRVEIERAVFLRVRMWQ